jgi:hypothetical protein
MRDAAPLAAAYEASGGLTHRVWYSRNSMPPGRPPEYLRLASEINRAALVSGDDWVTFRKEYAARLADVYAESPELLAALHSSIEPIVADLRSQCDLGLSFRIVDTGMQATFAMQVMCSLPQLLNRPNMKVDLHLLGAYPWLFPVFRGRCETSDADVVFGIEEFADVSNGLHFDHNAA